MRMTTTEKTVNILRQVFARYGLPRQIVSDNGPQFTSDVFKTFLQKLGIAHIRSAVKHPASNGAAENLVKTFKRKLKIMLKNGKTAQEAIDSFLAEYRSTRHCTTGETPAKLMLGRQLRTKFDLMRPDISKRREQAVQRQVRNSRGGRTTSFANGDKVWAKNFSRNASPWTEAEVMQRLGPVTYMVKLETGELVKRHLDQLTRAGTETSGRQGGDKEGGKEETLRRSARIASKKKACLDEPAAKRRGV